MQSAVDRLTDPSAYELRYRDISDDMTANPDVPGCAILHCQLPQPHNTDAVLICKFNSSEVIRIQLRGRGEGNDLLWDCSIFVPQYDRIMPKAKAQQLLEREPNILPASLLEQLGGKSIATTPYQSNALARYLIQKGITTNAFFSHLSTFDIEAEEFLKTAENHHASINFINKLAETVYDPTPLTTAFDNVGQDISRSHLRELQHRLIERYLSSSEMKNEQEVDAFIAVAADIRRDGKNPSLISLLSLRDKIYELDGDRELIAAFNNMSKVSDQEKKKRWATIVILPEIAHKLGLTKWQMLAAIKKWAVAPDRKTDKDTVRHLTMMQQEMPPAIMRNRQHIIVQLARSLSELEAGM